MGHSGKLSTSISAGIVVKIVDVLCTGCLHCIEVCPSKEVLRYSAETKKVFVHDVDKCSGCFACEPVCRTNAIRPIFKKYLNM